MAEGGEEIVLAKKQDRQAQKRRFSNINVAINQYVNEQEDKIIEMPDCVSYSVAKFEETAVSKRQTPLFTANKELVKIEEQYATASTSQVAATAMESQDTTVVNTSQIAATAIMSQEATTATTSYDVATANTSKDTGTVKMPEAKSWPFPPGVLYVKLTHGQVRHFVPCNPETTVTELQKSIAHVTQIDANQQVLWKDKTKLDHEKCLADYGMSCEGDEIMLTINLSTSI